MEHVSNDITVGLPDGWPGLAPRIAGVGGGDRARPSALAANLAALWVSDWRLAEALSPVPDSDEQVSYRLEAVRVGVSPPADLGGWEGAEPGDVLGATVQVPGADGRPMFLHTRIDPQGEARKLVDASHARGKSVVYVHGLGLGHAIQLLAPDLPEETLVLVFEPDLRLIRTALSLYDFSKLIEASKLMFVTRLERSELFDKIGPRGALLTLGCASIIHLPSLRRDEAFHRQMQQWVVDYTGFSRTGINTLVANGRKTAENVITNAARYAERRGIDAWRNRFEGRPGIVVAAGPSLKKNIHRLREAKGRAVIIAVQTALKPLLAAGIEPDIVTSLDYHSVCARFFQNLRGSSGAQLTSVLVVEAKAAPEVLDLYPGLVAVVGNDYAENLLRELQLDRATLPAGATVAHLSFYLARYLGCDPIAFVGQDLGFADGLCYVPGTGYDDVWQMEVSGFCSPEQKQWEQIARDRNILRQIPDVFGRPMYTEERLFTYLQQFERDFASTPQRVFDCTEGGAMKRGTTPLPLAEFLSRYASAELRVNLTVDAPGRVIGRAEVVSSLNKRATEAAEIGQIARQTMPLLDEIRRNLGRHAVVNRVIARIDVLRKRMNVLGPTYDLMQQFDQRSELSRFQADQRIVEQKLTGEALQAAQIARDIENVAAVAVAADQFAAHLGSVIAELGATPASEPVHAEAA